MADGAEDVQEPGFDPQIKDLAGWAGTVLYWLVWPVGIAIYNLFYYTSVAVLFVVKLIYRPLEFILLPIFYLLSFILNCLIAPFQFLARFETLYIYLGTAAIIGVGLGLIISLVYDSLRKPLGLDEAQASHTSYPNQERTGKQYRTEKRKRKAKAESPLMTAGYLSPSHLSLSDGARVRRNKGLLSQTILEEVDSDY